MRIAIIEDEIPAQKQLISLLNKLSLDYTLAFTAQSVKEAVALLRFKPALDLIFMDIQLNDGLSLSIFDQIELNVPVVFTTAYDQYTLNAFQSSGIDYLLKPLKLADLRMSLIRFEEMKKHFIDKLDLLKLQIKPSAEYIDRFLVKKGIRFMSVAIEEVAYFLSDHKITFLMTKSGEKMIYEKPLSSLEEMLNPIDFFRLNRKYIASIDSVDSFITDGKGKCIVSLQPAINEEVIVSQEKASLFKSWLSGN